MDYHSVFVGIPLPDNIATKFQEKIEAVANISPSLRLADLNSPHITLYFLGDQPEDVIPEVVKIVERHLDLLAEAHLRLNSIGTFGGNKPKVLFINVEPNLVLSEYQEAISEDLQVFRPAVEKVFSPHLTIGRIKESDRKDFARELPQIKELFKNEKWDFLANTISVYGIKNKKSPSQERLIDIDF